MKAGLRSSGMDRCLKVLRLRSGRPRAHANGGVLGKVSRLRSGRLRSNGYAGALGDFAVEAASVCW